MKEQALGLAISAGPMIVISVASIILQHPTIAVVAVFMAAILGGFTVAEIREKTRATE